MYVNPVLYIRPKDLKAYLNPVLYIRLVLQLIYY